MVTSSTLSPQIIGQAERALGALMNSVLTASGGTFSEWVALTITVGGDAGDRERLAEALGVDAWAASAIVSELIESDLLRTVPGSGQHLSLNAVRIATGASAPLLTTSPAGCSATRQTRIWPRPGAC
jgi:hypothetical protein